jgi:hypothetical protein
MCAAQSTPLKAGCTTEAQQQQTLTFPSAVLGTAIYPDPERPTVPIVSVVPVVPTAVTAVTAITTAVTAVVISAVAVIPVTVISIAAWQPHRVNSSTTHNTAQSKQTTHKCRPTSTIWGVFFSRLQGASSKGEISQGKRSNAQRLTRHRWQAAGRLSYSFNLKGPALAIDTAYFAGGQLTVTAVAVISIAVTAIIAPCGRHTCAETHRQSQGHSVAPWHSLTSRLGLVVWMWLL